ncbi:MAG: SBBP repeat-containing protein [Ignavibacteriae bacterium]|nr:SBBP repeat-containing protein [Ignavibacteriota bacterium]
MLKKIISFALLSLLYSNNLISQVSIEWAERYNNGISGNNGQAITSDDSGNVYVTGSSYFNITNRDMVVLKYSSSGLNKWVKREFASRFGSDISVDKFYNVYVAGDGLYKYDMDGKLLWNSPTPVGGAFYYISLDDTGNAYVGGSMSGGFYFITKKISPDGVILWERTYNNLDYNVVRDLTLDNSGSVLITGQSSQTGSLYDFVTIKYSNNGDQLWLRRYDAGSDDIPYGIASDNSNNVYVTGWNRNKTNDALTIKYSPEGDTLWKAIYDSGGEDVGYDVAVDSLGCIYIGGLTFGNSYLTLKYNNEGNLLWSRVQPGFLIGPPHPVIKLDKERNIYMSYVSRPSGNNYNYAVVKYDNNGVQKWIAEYDNKGNSSINYIYDLALDEYANALVTGRSNGSIATVKFIQNSTSINPELSILPLEYKLEQNYPNPFNPTTQLEYEISQIGFVSLKVYNSLGSEVAVLVNERKPTGKYNVMFDGNNLSSGIYFYRLSAGDFSETKSMILLK